MSQAVQKTRLEQAREYRESTVAIMHSCGHTVNHPIVGQFGVQAFVEREEGRVCLDCSKALCEANKQKRIDAKKAELRMKLEAVATKLLALEILQAEGGELPALELVIRVIAYFKNCDKDAHQMCKELGLARDEIVRVERFL
jgi:hypothetical protein